MFFNANTDSSWSEDLVKHLTENHVHENLEDKPIWKSPRLQQIILLPQYQQNKIAIMQEISWKVIFNLKFYVFTTKKKNETLSILSCKTHPVEAKAIWYIITAML